METERLPIETNSSELTAATALTKLVEGCQPTEKDPSAESVDDHDDDVDDDGDDEDMKDAVEAMTEEKTTGSIEYPLQFTKSGRKRATPFPVKVSYSCFFLGLVIVINILFM